jgi:hypothetical protein
MNAARNGTSAHKPADEEPGAAAKTLSHIL